MSLRAVLAAACCSHKLSWGRWTSGSRHVLPSAPQSSSETIPMDSIDFNIFQHFHQIWTCIPTYPNLHQLTSADKAVSVPLWPLKFLHSVILKNNRRKFRSQTSDNMDRWKQRWEELETRGEEERRSKRERVRRKKIQVREKVGKSRNTVFFQWVVAPEGRKVGSLKRRVRSQLARWKMKNCTPLWREAHLEVKMHKTPHVRSTFRSWDVEKVHADVARCTRASEKA